MTDKDQSISTKLVHATGEFNIPLRKVKLAFLLGQLLEVKSIKDLELNLLLLVLCVGGGIVTQLIIGTWATIVWIIAVILVCLLVSGRFHRWTRKLRK